MEVTELVVVAVVGEEDDDDDGGPATRIKKNPRKRRAPDYTNGEEWAKKKSHVVVSDDIVAEVNEIQKLVKEYLTFTPEFVKFLSEEASKYHATGCEPNYGVSGKLTEYVFFLWV